MTSENSDVEPDEFEPGYVIDDRYEVREPLGEGGFAVVYEAFDRTIERPIALKVLNIEQLSQGGQQVELIRKRFLREARLAAKIRHPNVIEIYDFGVLDESEQPYMMMEFLEGKDLDREIKQKGYIDSKRLLPLFVQTLEGLGEAHREGVVHKDLKPANLFLTRPGTSSEQLKIVDFGIAHVHEDVDERLTKTDAFTGTPYYLPQEYLQDQKICPQMDVYQMGLILVEALTGQRVIVAETAYQAAIKHISREFEIAPELLEGPLGEVIERSIAFDPEERFATGTEFAKALAQVDPESVRFHPDRLDTEAAGGVSVTAATEAQFGGTASGGDPVDKQEPPGGDTGSVSQSLGVDTISAAFGSSWPVKALGALAVAIVVTLAVLVVVVFSSDEPDQQEPTQQQAVAEAEADDQPDEPQQKPEVDDAPPEQPEVREVAIESSPSDATLLDKDGATLGTTPTEIELEEGEPLAVNVEHPGYESEEVIIDGAEGDEISVELEQADEEREQPPQADSPPPQERQRAESPQPPWQDDEPDDETEQPDDQPEDQPDEQPDEQPDQQDEDWAMPGASDQQDDEQDDEGYRLAP